MTDIMYGPKITDDVKLAVEGCAMIVTDANVAALYPDLCKNAFVIPPGEKSKSQETLFAVLAEMSSRGIKRGDRIAAVGGGVVGDVTGLAAALYMRGIKWVCVPTTLLAMVDSCIGGKTAIDLCGIKNLVGAFHDPERVVISYEFLETLYEEDWLCGYGEIIKTCLLTKSSFEYLRDNISGLSEYDRGTVFKLIDMCIDIKKAVVYSDPRENGLRRILNVGHTVGHALESVDGFKSTHGEYVLKGMLTECAMCRDIIDEEYYAELIKIFSRFTVPPRTTGSAVLKCALRDKKNGDDYITVMLPVAPGEVLEVHIAGSDFAERYDGAIKELRRA